MPPLYQQGRQKEQEPLDRSRSQAVDERYQGGRSMLNFLQAVGWVVVVIGIIFCVGAIAAQPSSGFSPSGQSGTMKILAFGYGAAVAVAGLLLAALCRVGHAVFDIAEAVQKPDRNGASEHVKDGGSVFPEVRAERGK